MTSEELETIVCNHEMQRLELKESFGVECIETACAFTNAQGGFIKRNIHCALVITPGKVDHDPMWDYPIETVRETLANALCHRDYGAPYDIQVKIFEDSLCISSPGQLPFDMPMEFLMKPTYPSRPRNKLIAQAFFDMGIIERYGSGIKRIKKECDKDGKRFGAWEILM